MEIIGEWLRQKREELGLTIDNISEITKYPPEVIRKVEEGRPGVFPAEVYFNVFLKAYGRALGLDPEEVLRARTSEEERASAAIRDLRVKSPVGHRSHAFVKPIAVGVVIAAVVGYIAYSLLMRGEYTIPEGYRHPPSKAYSIAGNESTSVAAQSSEGGLRGVSDSPSHIQASQQIAQQTVEKRLPVAQSQTGKATSSISPEMCLEVIAKGGFYIEVANEDTTIKRTLSSGDKLRICSRRFLKIVALTNRHSASLLLNGKPYKLPDSFGKEVYDFVIRPPRSGE